MSDTANREETLFATALALAPEARREFLDRECADDTVLRTRIERLLRADESAGEFLETPVEPAPPLPPMPVPLAEGPGFKIGRYKLLEKIGEGGCGVVFMAEQEEPVRRRVALKIVKLGMDTREVIARFEAERQALAMMDHPNIARVLDAGATDTGRPYFVMELVRGVKITDYCDENDASTDERLNLFISVCHAIQHAHHKGVIHRDIKPSNILITLHDGTPVPKVIDFGIAKATQGRLTERTLFTAFQQFVGTPAYMSPEQAEMSDLDIDTRSDIYSLGVLLYELLTGRPPFATKELMQAGVFEMRRRILEHEPPRPSTQLGQLDDATLTATARRRRAAPVDLKRALHGDLDCIVMRCLEKDRLRRYQTAIGIVADIRRHLGHEPIEARRPHPFYVLQKFVRRHRVGFGASAAILLVLVATSAVSLRLALVARRAEARAASEAAAAKQVIDFLQNDLLAPAQPDQPPVWDLKLRTVLDRANKSLEGRLANQPLVEASLRETMAATYKSLGEFAIERAHLEKALEIYRRHNGAEAPATLALATQLADAYWNEGRYVDAEKLCRETQATQERTLGFDHPDTLRSAHLLASILWDQGRLSEALELHKDTMRTRERVLGRDHPDTLNSMQDLAQAFRGFGKYYDAATLGRRTLEAKRRVLGPEDPSTLSAMNSLAMTYRAQGQFADAETLHRTVLDIRRRTLGPEHPATLVTMTNLVSVFQDQGRYAEAERMGTQTLNTKRRTLGLEHPSTLNSASLLAQVYEAQGRLTEAAAMHNSVLEIRQRTLGPEHPDTLLSMHYVADTLRARGELDSAAASYERILEARRRTLTSDHPATLQTMDDLGRVLLRQKKFAEAETLLRNSLAGHERAAFQGWRTAATRGLLAEALVGLERHAEAERLFIAALRVLVHPPDAIPAAQKTLARETGDRLIALFRDQGRVLEAREWEFKLGEMFGMSAAGSATANPTRSAPNK